VAAAYYWQHLFPDAWQFFRKREGPPPNNLLNYGYAILRATVARALTGAGLLPTLGIFHRNRYNAYCLADDIMEPYRPFVDVIVRTIIDKTSAVDTLTKEFKVEEFADGTKSRKYNTTIAIDNCFKQKKNY
jgi:CRISPR-associated protein Cas1